MSELSDIVQVTISRETQAVSQAGFGVPAIISEFSTAKTTTTFGRTRFYSSLTEMASDGWTVYDFEYKAAQKIFSQNPRPSRLMIGRRDSGDANLTAALDAIQIDNADWYAFGVIFTKVLQVDFDIDFVTGNSISGSINGNSFGPVPFNTNQQTTMGDLETAIEAAVPNCTVTVGGSPYRTMTIEITDSTPSSGIITTTGGATQPVATFTYVSTGVEDEAKEAAAWVETQKKIFGISWGDSDTITSATTDLASFLQSQNYDRTIFSYHPDGPLTMIPSWMEFGWFGEGLPYDPGSQTWAYKTIAGVASYNLTSSERGYALGKNANIYTECAGVDITEEGKVASGEYIDIIRGLDWLESRLQEAIFAQLVNVRKIPFTDPGITMVGGIIQGVLNEAAGQGILVADSIVLDLPKAADVSQTDKANRLLPDITFEATLQGAIHKVRIQGTVVV